MKALGRALMASAMLAGLGMSGAAMGLNSVNAFNYKADRMAAGRAFGYMPTSKHVRKTNKLRCKHNAKLKRRKAR